MKVVIFIKGARNNKTCELCEGITSRLIDPGTLYFWFEMTRLIFVRQIIWMQCGLDNIIYDMLSS